MSFLLGYMYGTTMSDTRKSSCTPIGYHPNLKVRASSTGTIYEWDSRGDEPKRIRK